MATNAARIVPPTPSMEPIMATPDSRDEGSSTFGKKYDGTEAP